MESESTMLLKKKVFLFGMPLLLVLIAGCIFLFRPYENKAPSPLSLHTEHWNFIGQVSNTYVRYIEIYNPEDNPSDLYLITEKGSFHDLTAFPETSEIVIKRGERVRIPVNELILGDRTWIHCFAKPVSGEGRVDFHDIIIKKI